MTFKQGLYRARSHIIFILALFTAFGLIVGLEEWDPDFGLPEVRPTPDMPFGAIAPLSEQERQWATIAWAYFEVHLRPETGLVDAVAGIPVISMDDLGAYMMAIIAAHRLQIISEGVFRQRMGHVLETLIALSTSSLILPNRYYATTTLSPVDAGGNIAAESVGWSALEISRLLIPFHILTWQYPEFTPQLRTLLKNWHIDNLVDNGVLYSRYRAPGKAMKYAPEGRIGFDEYAARAVSLAGQDAFMARQYREQLQWKTIYGVKIPTDRRGAFDLWDYGTASSDPYILHGLEFGWDVISKELAYRIYLAQERRHEKTGLETAVGIGYTDRAQQRVAYAIYAQGREWVGITASGDMSDDDKTVDIAIAFGWHALYRTPYTQMLVNSLASLHNPKTGWHAGRYENDQSTNRALTCRTNAMILKALCYKAHGPLVKLQ